MSESRRQPQLRLIHDEQSFSQTSLAYWRTKTVDYILDSFGSSANPDYSALQVKADGTVLNGNTRLFVLRQKGYDIETISWTPMQ